MPGNAEQRVQQAIADRYQNVYKTKKDSMNLLNHYRGLSPKLDRFVFNDGQTKEMLTLDGTIPVPYKGSIYNIPICLWLLDNHPNSAPMAYVKPTPDMLIKASRNVDQNGKVYLPYLHEWNPNSSDLVGLVQMMIMTFSEMPPVYAKPKGGGNQAPPPATTTATPYPATPYPTQPGGYMPPPYSPSGGGYPSYPSPGYPPSSTGGYAAPYGHQPTPYPIHGATPTAGLPYPAPYSPSANSTAAESGPHAATTIPSATGTITEEHIRLSLVSAVGDRVRDKLRDKYGDAQAEVAVLRQQKADLERGRDKLNTMVSKLNTEQSEVQKSVRVLREREGELRLLVEQTEATKHELDIDEAVTTTAPLYRQLVNAYAEEQATQDAVYYLGEALRRSVLDLDTYLRHVRALSRKQYQLRATMTLCRQKANLAG